MAFVTSLLKSGFPYLHILIWIRLLISERQWIDIYSWYIQSDTNLLLFGALCVNNINGKDSFHQCAK
jgi:hypothetical protein